MDAARAWIEQSPYTQDLGVELAELETGRARLRVPYRDQNSNPGRALHGGVAASLAATGAQVVVRAAGDADAGPWHTCALHVSYLSAAIGEDVEAEALLLRRGKAIGFAEVDVRTTEGKRIAHATATVHARAGAPPVELAPGRGDDGAADPGPLGPHITKTPFMGRRGIRVEHMAGGRARLVLPYAPHNADRDGGVHEGALLALLDTTGAMAAWAETGPGRYKASTPTMQAQVLAPPPRDDLVARAALLRRDGELFWSEVEVATASDARAVARGTVLYRIVT